MLKTLLFLILYVTAATSHNQYERYYRNEANPFATSESLDHSIRIQSAVRVSEVALSDKNGCLRRSICVLGAISSTSENGNLPKKSIANGAQNFLHIVERMIAVAGMTGLTKDELPNLRQVVASNVVGKSSGDLRMCESLFPCPTSVEQIKREALLVTTSSKNHADSLSTGGLFSTLFAPTLTTDPFQPSFELREGRSTCKIAGTLCPGITIGCALCGVFAPATCGDTCIIAGLYCGTSGYACQFAASQTSADEVADDVEEETEVIEEIEAEEDTLEDVEGSGRSSIHKGKNTRQRFFRFPY